MKSLNRLTPLVICSLFIHIFLCITLNPSYAIEGNRIKIGVSKNNPPFSEFDKRDAITRGYSVDLAKLIAENAGLSPEVYAMNESDLIRALTHGEVDMIIGIKDKFYVTQDLALIETKITGLETKLLVNSECMSVKSYKDLAGWKVAIEKGRHFPWLLPSEHKDIDFVEADTTDDALALVNSGKAQAYISKNFLSTIYTIQKNRFQNIKGIGDAIEVSPLVIALDNKNPELLKSVTMAYRKILENNSDYAVYDKWLGNDLRFYMSRYMKVILVGVGIGLFALLSFIFWNYTLKSKIALITEDLRNSEKKYRDLIESSPDMIYLISRHGEIRLANKIALNHMGYDEKELSSLRLHDLVLPEETGRVRDFIDEVFRDKYSNKKFTFRSKEGNKIQVEMAATIMKESSPADELACCFSRDITERMRLEENLIHADRLAIMGRMAAGIAHEINNPLGIILANAQDMLYHALDDKDAVESLKLIESSALKTAKIIEDMLNFTSPGELQIVPINLPQLIDASLGLLKQRLKQKKITVEKRYPAGIVNFNGDENLIQQLLINIFLNSIQAIRNEGMIRISINEIRDNGNGRIIMEIEDNGAGIPEEDMQKIFTPFFTSRRENGGFGLGLFISKIIVEKHNGSLAARSEERKGTTMKVEFPFN